MSAKGYFRQAYDLEGPEDARRLYGAWAPDYDSEMIEAEGYRGPEILAVEVERRVSDRTGWIVDIGCGTGLVGQYLAERGFANVDGIDLVQEMLDQAAAKSCYSRLIRGNLLDRVPVNDDRYDIAVSAGTFTHSHVGPDGLDEVMRIVKPGGRALILCNGEAFASDGYEGKLRDLARLGLADLTESVETDAILGNGLKGRLLVLDIHR
ncbi:MAG: class I SAM-dependent methyltransferase [Geminicoccaceae bacterium]|nr:class I SAM-dependent methyltransferase [Geminicoccaceae bacterium]